MPGLVCIQHATLVAHILDCSPQLSKTPIADPARVEAKFVLRLLAQAYFASCTRFCLVFVFVIATFVPDDDSVAHC